MSDDPIEETVKEPEHVNPAPEHTPPPVPDPSPETHKDDATSLVHALEVRVDALAATVQSLVPQERDSTPTKRPWTHYGNNR
jgi:hypothetical protein